MLRILFFILLPFLFNTQIYSQKLNLTITGTVYNFDSKEPLENCNIYVSEIQKGTSTDKFGKFKIKLPTGMHELKFSFLGFKSESKLVELKDKNLDIEIFLSPEILKSEEIKITAKREPASIIIQEIENKDVQKMPTIYSDVLRSVQILSGVATNSELTSGYNVRGGSFDENLIYLNGYEIYRPFLLRIGVEENQTIINPNMVEKLTFYNGAFPSSYGDRMSSALEVKYANQHDKKIKGTISTSILNAGISLNNNYRDFNWSIGARYAYPTAFLSHLRTQGDYKPSFSDFQFFGNYKLSSNSYIELLGIYADNRFDISPTNWTGNFGFSGRGDFRGIKISSDGERTYSYLNNLLGLKYVNAISDKSEIKFSISKYWVNEKEKYDLESEIFYIPDAYNPTENLQYLKSRYEKGDNSIELNSYRFKLDFTTNYGNHNFLFGTEYRLSDIKNYNHENFYEIGDSLLNEKPINTNYSSKYNLNSANFFIEDYILINQKLEANIGLRYLRYDYSNENLFSPRAYITYKLSPFNSFKLSWGYYYQPPFINELKSTKISNLKSQRAIHYVLGWENQVNEKLKFNAEIYYKDLYNLIPFYFDEFRMVYVEENNREGYALGLDLMYEGEVVEGMKSWIGYSYLDTKERKIGSEDSYQRRLLDQTHTVQIFLQDRMRKHPNWQSHLRFLLGSGYLYYQRKLVTDQETSEQYIDVDFTNPQEYFFYFRVDMGLSAAFKLGKDYKLTAIAEVLNIFNQFNAGTYEWVHIFKEFSTPMKVPHVLSSRFFNLKVEVSF